MQRLTESRYANILFPLALILLTLVVYARVWDYGFISVWDDNINVLTNPYIRDFSLRGIRKIFNPASPISEPRLTLFTYALDFRLWQFNPRPYHIVNLCLHLCNVMLIYLIAKSLLHKYPAAFIVALLFAVHPFRIEPVVWISGRKDLLYSLFYLLGLVAFCRYTVRQNFLWFILVLFIAWLSSMSKIQSLVFPASLFLVDIYQNRKVQPGIFLEKVVVMSVMLVGMLGWGSVLALIIFHFLYSYYHRIAELYNRFLPRFKIQLRLGWQSLFIYMTMFLVMMIVVFLLGQSGLNIKRSFIYGIILFFIVWGCVNLVIISKSFHRSWLIHICIALSGVGLAILLILAGFLDFPAMWSSDYWFGIGIMKRILMAGYSMLVYLISSLFPYYLSAIRPYPDLEASLPAVYYIFSVLTLICLAGIILWLNKSKAKLPVLGFAFFVINIFLVLHLIPIEGRVIVAERYSYLGYAGLFLMIGYGLAAGWKVSKRFDKLMLYVILFIVLINTVISFLRIPVWKNETALMNEVVRKNPKYPMGYLNRSTIFINQGRYSEAIDDLNQAIFLDSTYYQAFYNRALAYSRLRIFDKAATDCSDAVRLAPAFADAYYLRAYCQSQLGHYTEAIAGYSVALRLQPLAFITWYNRGNANKNIHNYKEAISDYNIAISLNPSFAEAYNARGVAWFFLGQTEKAITDYTLAIERDSGNGNFYYNRGVTFKASGNTQSAIQDLRLASQYGYLPANDVLNAMSVR